jgi:transcription antitermination protein NusB
MVSRRILRIKIMQALYAFFTHDGQSTINKSEKELHFSIQKTHDLYHYLLILIIDLVDFANSRMELAMQKRIPTYEDLHPNLKFIHNKVIEQIRTNDNLRKYLQEHKLSWINYPELIRGLYNEVIESPEYVNYIETSESSYAEDKNFVCLIFTKIMTRYEPLYANLEEQSIYWNDEIDYIIGIIIKTLKKFKEEDGENSKLMPLFKSTSDEDFSKILLRKVILNHKEYREMIEKYSKNWDIDRIAFVDILLMQMAIAEVIEIQSIPIKVTLNEYLELSKFYSTPKSNVFINGILDKIIIQLKEENKINKQGRGLMGDD